MTNEQEVIERLKYDISAGEYSITKTELLETALKMLKEKDKQIELMSERIEWLCKSNGILLDVEHGENFFQEDIKQYFEKLAKEKGE